MTPPKSTKMPERLRERRDALLRDVWVVMRELSDVEVMSEEDLDVWGTVTKHSAIQRKLEAARKEP